MGIVASYLVKVHLHDDSEGAGKLTDQDLTNDQVKDAVIEGVKDNLGFDATVSLIERTDS